MTEIILEVSQGKLKGIEERNYKGEIYFSFKGIPYAKPPFGKLRFRAPEPPESWTGILDATKHSEKCAQIDSFPVPTKKIIGSDDCLYLNIYTSKNPVLKSDKNRPVMVWIHGGAFIGGSGDSSDQGPDYILGEDVILVTFNYRLGILGFLQVDDPEVGISGNAGLKDMVMALKWVKGNIEKFGGNPENVTIFGESAGGVSVQMLTLSPLGKGLFHRAIIQSASVLADWAFASPGIKTLKEIAKVLNLNDKNDSEIVQQLEKLSYKELIEAHIKLKSVFGSQRIFAPVIENKSSKNPILSDDPLRIIKSGKINKVPIIIGYNSREGMSFALRFMQVCKTYDSMIPLNLKVKKGSPERRKIAENVGNFYYGGEEPSEKNLDILSMLFTDTSFLYPILAVLNELIKVNQENIYLYRFSLDDPRVKFIKKLIKLDLPGTCHSDELPFLFKMDLLPLKIIPNSVEDVTIRRFTKLWTNFAKTGNPNPENEQELIPIQWERVENENFNYLEFGENLTIGINPDWKRYQFWENIFNSIHS